MPHIPKKMTDGMRTLIAYLNSRRVGVLSEGDDLWRFEYDAEWVKSPTTV